MSSIELYAQALKLLESERPFALATVIRAAGSTPQKAGANALIEAAGPIWGTLGGGCLEAEARQRALQSLDDGKPNWFDLKLDEVTGWDDGLICGGKVRIFVDPATAKNAETYHALMEAADRKERGVLTTVLSHPIHSPGTVFWVPETKISETSLISDPQILREHLEKEKSGAVEIAGQSADEAIYLYLEPVIPAPRLIIAGAGHIGKATAHLANLLGFEVTIIDDRPVFANSTNVPDARHVICGDIAKEMARQSITPETCVLIVTRGHRHDGAVLAACIHSPAKYIGMIGSRRKSLMIRQSLVKEGLASEEEVNRVVSPVGLDIGALSVQEIALSIMAQLVALRRAGKLDAQAKNFCKHDQRHHSRGGRRAPDGPPKAAPAVR